MELLRKNLHPTDTVLRIEPHWIVIFAAVDRKGLEAIVRRLPNILEETSRDSFDFGTALCPRDGNDTNSLFSKAKALS